MQLWKLWLWPSLCWLVPSAWLSPCALDRLAVEKCSNIQPDPPLAQLEALSSCPVTCSWQQSQTMGGCHSVQGCRALSLSPAHTALCAAPLCEYLAVGPSQGSCWLRQQGCIPLAIHSHLGKGWVWNSSEGWESVKPQTLGLWDLQCGWCL